jgi:hypothetical protein
MAKNASDEWIDGKCQPNAPQEIAMNSSVFFLLFYAKYIFKKPMDGTTLERPLSTCLIHAVPSLLLFLGLSYPT